MSGPGATPACREFEGYRRASVCLPTVARYRVALTVSFAARLLSVLPLVLIIALLAGCATVPQTPLVSGVNTEVVKIPVNVRCVSLKELPTIPKTRMEPGPTTSGTLADMGKAIEQWVIQVQIDFNNLEDYVLLADARLRACATEPLPEKAKP